MLLPSRILELFDQRIGEVVFIGFPVEVDNETEPKRLMVRLLVILPQSFTRDVVLSALSSLSRIRVIEFEEMEIQVHERSFLLKCTADNTLAYQQLDLWERIFQEKVIKPNMHRLLDHR